MKTNKMKKKVFHRILFALIAILLLVMPEISQAQTAAQPETGMGMYNIILFVIFFLLMNVIFIPLLRHSPVYGTEGAVAVKKESVIKKLYDKLTGLKPISQERELLMDEDYDGIAELDNNIPPWFNILFYSTVVFAVVYLLSYHVFKIGRLPLQEYADEVYAADLKRQELIMTGAFINENTVAVQTDKAALDNGKQVFVANCVPCHGPGGEGTVGPNLTDEFWIHGGGIKNVFKTIKYGVPAKGMISWQNQFNPRTMQDVASYVITLQGTNPPNAKAPEGEKYIDTGSDSTTAAKDTTKSAGMQDTGKVAAKDTLKSGQQNAKDTSIKK